MDVTGQYYLGPHLLRPVSSSTMRIQVKLRYRLFQRRNGIFFIEDRVTGKQASLQTRDPAAAQRIFNAKNESYQQPAINLQIARAYLMAIDPLVAKRSWGHVMAEIVKFKKDATLQRWQTAIKDKAFDDIRALPLLETQAEQLLRVLEKGTISTNVYLRRLHNFCLDMNWLPWPVIPKKQWPQVQYKDKRALTLAEHEAIIARETNRERRDFYKLCWHLGASQGDIARLLAEDVDWENKTISFFRRKTGTPVIVHLGPLALEILKDLSGTGALFPYLSTVRSGDRATEFKQRCVGLGIKGITLHSYRYAWAERAKVAGYPERFAQVALGHNSKAVHRAYARHAQVKLPALEDYEHSPK
jgi:integrase